MPSELARVWELVATTTSYDDCWLWSGPLRARTPILPGSGHWIHPRRVLWTALHGRPARGYVLPACGTSRCVNPWHLVESRTFARVVRFQGGSSMTLDTKVAVHMPIPLNETFDFVNGLIGGTGARNNKGHPDTWSDGRLALMNEMSQGLPAWLIVIYRADAPLRSESEDGAPACAYDVSFDTAYSYRGPNGATCSDLHAWIVRELGAWLDSRGSRWSWCDEYNGEWHEGAEGLDKFADASRGKLTVDGNKR